MKIILKWNTEQTTKDENVVPIMEFHFIFLIIAIFFKVGVRFASKRKVHSITLTALCHY